MKKISQEQRFNGYLELAKMSYQQAVDTLKEKYGGAKEDYFTEDSYTSFILGERKTLVKGKSISRTREGLYCHHVMENQGLNLANKTYLQHFGYPFDWQRKENLVYCDAVEHMILHAIITKETHGSFGYPGYTVFLQPEVLEWYYSGVKPKPTWQVNCYNKAFLNPSQVKQVVQACEKLINQA